MADIDLVIRISEEDFEIMRHNIAVNNPLCPLSQEEMVSKVAKGTPLPKGHGRLIDADKLHEEIENIPIKDGDKWFNVMQKTCMRIAEAPTIIEADKAEREE